MDDVVGEIGFRLKPYIDPQDVQQAAQQAAQIASAAASSAAAAGVRTRAAMDTPFAARGMLPSPGDATAFPVIGPRGDWIGDRAAAAGPSLADWARGGAGRGAAFDPAPLVTQIRELESLAGEASNKNSRAMLQAAAAGFRSRLTDAGFDYDQLRDAGPRAPLLTPEPPQRGIARRWMTSDGANLGGRGGRGGNGGGGPSAGGADDEWHPLARRPAGSSARPRAPRRADAADEYEFEGEVVGPSADPFTDAHGRKTRGRSTFRSVRGMRTYGPSPFQLAAKARRLAGRRVLTNGMFMNVIFGGGEAAKAIANSRNATMKAAMESDSAARATIEMQAYQSVSGGFLGSLAGVLVDPTGSRAGAVQSTLGQAKLQDAASSAMMQLQVMNTANRTPAPRSGVGQDLQAMTSMLDARSAAVAERLGAIKAQGDAAGRVAEAGAQTWLGQLQTSVTDFLGVKNAGGDVRRERERVAQAGADARRPFDQAYETARQKQQAADQAGAMTLVADFVHANEASAAAHGNEAKYAGDPVALARANRRSEAAAKVADVSRDDYRQAFEKKLADTGMSADAARQQYNAMVTSVVTDQQKATESLEAGIRENQRSFDLSAGQAIGLSAAFRTGGNVGAMRQAAENDIANYADQLGKAGFTGEDFWNRKKAFEKERRTSVEADIAFGRGMTSKALGGSIASMDRLLNNEPFDAQREAVKAQWDIDSDKAWRDDPEGYQNGIGAKMQEERDRRLKLIDKQQADSGTAISLSFDTQARVLSATINAANGTRSRYAPRAESIVGALQEEVHQLKISGHGDQVARAREVAGLQIDADQAEFFGAFRPVQHSSLAEVDPSGREVGNVLEDFGQARGDLDNVSMVTPASAVRKVLNDTLSTQAYRFFRNSNQAMEDGFA